MSDKTKIQDLISKFNVSQEKLHVDPSQYNPHLSENNEENRCLDDRNFEPPIYYNEAISYSSIPVRDNAHIGDGKDNSTKTTEGVQNNNEHYERESRPSYLLTASRKVDDDEEPYSTNLVEDEDAVIIRTVETDDERESQEFGSRRISSEEFSSKAVEENETLNVRAIDNALRVKEKEQHDDDNDTEEPASRGVDAELKARSAARVSLKYTILMPRSTENPDVNNNDAESPKKGRINKLLDTLIGEEELYVADLQVVIEKYIPFIYKNRPPHLLLKSGHIFGNLEDIYRTAQDFLALIKRHSDSFDKIAKTFYESTVMLDSYTQYLRNKPKGDAYLHEFNDVIRKAQKKFKDPRSLEDYLLAPWQRLAKYIVTLEQIQKELKQLNKKSDLVSSALGALRGVIARSNHLLAVDSIRFSKIDKEKQGSYIKRQMFKILKPKKFESMMFLFENAIIITEKDSETVDKYTYVDSIELSNLTLRKLEGKKRKFDLTKHVGSQSKNSVTYVVEADTPKVKNEWIVTLENILWNQLKTAKESRVAPSYSA